MRDFLTGGAITAAGLVFVIIFSQIHVLLPAVLFGIFIIVLFVRHMKQIVEMIKSGEIVHVNQFWF